MSNAVKFFLLSLISLVFLSCEMTVEDSSFTAKLETIDKFINQTQYKEASALLKDLEKASFTAFHNLSVAKRYVGINEFDSAINVLEKFLKKNDDNVEVRSVLTWCLLRTEQFEKACEVSYPLVESSYSGLYAESRLRYLSSLKKDFLEEDLLSEYIYAYNTTGLIQFLQNAAVYQCYQGNYKDAFSYHPIKLPNDKNAEFWAYVSYDSGNYIQAIEDAEKIPSKYQLEKDIITADSYLRMRELALAQKTWEKIIRDDKGSDPSVLMNCILASLNNGKIDEGFEFSKKLVKEYPDYVPGLISYGEFVLHYGKPDEESSLTKALRAKGLKSTDMVIADSKPKIPISDPLHRMEESIKKRDIDDSERTLLQIEFLKLKWASHPEMTSEEMVLDVWAMVETNSTLQGTNNSYLTDFVVDFFIKQNNYDQAEQILASVLMGKFESCDYVALADKLNFEECRNASSILVERGRYKDAQILLEKALEKSSEIPIDIYLNLGNFEESQNNLTEAMKYYSLAEKSAKDIYLKSEAYYRIACVYATKGDIKNTKLYLDYCLVLNPGHVKARLMDKKIRNQA